MNTITLPVKKMFHWTSQGEGSEAIAQRLGVTVEDMYDALDSLAERNRKSATCLKQRLSVNDKRPKPHAATQATKPATVSTPATIDESQAKPTTTKTAQEAAPITKKTTVSAGVKTLQLEIEKVEHALQGVDTTAFQANDVIDQSKQTALKHEKRFKELAAELEQEMAAYESEKTKLKQAEETLIACEGRRTNLTKRLAELKTQLKAAAKPEIYVCEDGVQCENITEPEHIDVSNWHLIYGFLPEEIGNELRPRDAKLLIRLRAIVATVEREDLELAFESETLEAAYKALEAAEPSSF